ncbi:hypothetical protein ACB092_11G126000 [Castanea dentata]
MLFTELQGLTQDHYWLFRGIEYTLKYLEWARCAQGLSCQHLSYSTQVKLESMLMQIFLECNQEG